MADDRALEHAPGNEAARRQAEETVRFQAQVLDYIGQAVIATDLDGAIIYANRFAERLYGWSVGEMAGRTIADVTVPQIGREETEAIMARLRAGESWRGEFVVRRRDGSTFPAEATNTPIRAADGTLVGVVGISVDITERRQAEADLRLQSAALNAAADAIVITDPTGAIEWVNRAFTESSGFEVAEVIGRNPRELFKSGMHDRAFYQRLWETIQAGRVWQGEMTNRRKDGRLVPEELTITPVRDGAGAIAHFVAIKRDLTEMKRLQSEVVQAQKLETVGRLAGGIAHDFNNLLTVINATAELAANDPDTPEGVRTDLGHIRAAGERAASLTRQLLAFSRKQILQPVVLDIDALVRNLRSMLPRLIGEDIELAVRSPAVPARVKADPSQIEQVILNLVVNARDAMPDGGRLTIETASVHLDDEDVARHGAGRAGPHVMLAVTDTGIGMDDATRAQIFEPFFTTKEPGKGTGLGLSTVYGIVHQSGGGIWVYSEPGMGTTFRIYLPRFDAAPAEASREAPQAAGGSETILVVEDDASVRRLAERVLTMAGYTVLAAGDVATAEALLERDDTRVDAIVTDVVLPGTSGRALADYVAAHRPSIRILFTSGYTDDAIVHHGVLDEGVAFLSKPYSTDELRRRVRELLDG